MPYLIAFDVVSAPFDRLPQSLITAKGVPPHCLHPIDSRIESVFICHEIDVPASRAYRTGRQRRPGTGGGHWQ
jgi:hypothetical protein